jgi:hypothetical protein
LQLLSLFFCPVQRVLSINILDRSCGIPIAWKVVKAGEKGSWKPYWQELFESFREIIPSHWTVIVCAERGLYADWLYSLIEGLDCTLLARWDEGYTDPWLILTNFPPQQSDVTWYSLRSWIECSYRDFKSDG